MKLGRKYVEKPWGRTKLPDMFHPPQGQKIGEVWFTGAPGLPLLAKYIFTSERLSIQVHPDDEQAKALGLPCGKTECWYILEAEPGACIGLGLTRAMTGAELRAAALDGSIEHLVDWKAIRAGDFVLVPPGTIHAIGAGIALLEFQQNVDVTYRLYDYGRPRELHLDEAIKVAAARPFDAQLAVHVGRSDRRILVDGPAFRLVSSNADNFADARRWIMPLEGRVRSGDEIAEAGDCLLAEPFEVVEADNAWLLVGTSG